MAEAELEIISHSTAAEDGLVGVIARAEIDTLIATARQYPRSIAQAQKRMMDLATLDEESADDAVYSLPRGGKTLEGPSIRFAELSAQSWGNNRVAARTTAIDRNDKFVEAEGFFLDAETNVATLARVRRRISDSRGKLYNEDMIMVTCNAAQSIARRNAILAGIPKAVWRKPYEAARRVIMGDIKTLANRRADAIKSFQRFGLTEAQVLLLMSVKGVEDIDQEKLVPLRGMYSSLVNQDVTVEELLRAAQPDNKPRVTAVTAIHTAPTQFAADVPTADGPAPAVTVAAVEPDKKPDTKSTDATETAVKPTETAAEQPAVEPAKNAAPTETPIDYNGIMGRVMNLVSKVRDAARLDAVLEDYADDLTKLDASRKTMVDQLVAKKRASFKR